MPSCSVELDKGRLDQLEKGSGCGSRTKVTDKEQDLTAWTPDMQNPRGLKIGTT